MHVTYNNATEAFDTLPSVIMDNGVSEETRNGLAYYLPEPVIMTIENPLDRIIINDVRDINPTAVLLETLWVLAGRNDVGFLTKYLKNLADYSDDGYTWRGAYGYRWMHHFGKDQIQIAIERLKAYPDDRRTMISMWDATMDLNEGNDYKDLPCNFMLKPSIREGKLDLTVFNRSNDLVWGALNVNIVQFTILQEYLAMMVGVPVGSYHLVSDNLHIYEATAKKVSGGKTYVAPSTSPLFNIAHIFRTELKEFMIEHDSYEEIQDEYVNPILDDAKHMVNAYRIWKCFKNPERALKYLEDKPSTPWLYATKQWYIRRTK